METFTSHDEATFVTAELQQFIFNQGPEEADSAEEPLHPLADERILKQAKLAITTERVIEVQRRHDAIVGELVALCASATIRVARIDRLKKRKQRVQKTLANVRNEYLSAIKEVSDSNESIKDAQIATHALIRALQPPEPYDTPNLETDEVEPTHVTQVAEAA